MYSIVLAIHVLVALALIGLVLLQHGRGADVGAAFGAGASGSVFGSRGPATFLSRTTAVLAAVFFFTSLSLAWITTTQVREQGSVVERVQPAQQQEPQPGGPAEEGAQPAPSDIPTAPGGGAPATGGSPSDVPDVPPQQ